MNDEAVIKQAEQEIDAILLSDGKDSQSSPEEINESKKTQTIFSIDDILSMPDIHAEWLIEPFVLSHGITIVSGLPNHFKSFFVQILVKAVATGQPFLNRFSTNQGAVLVIDREVPKQRLKKRWGTIGELHGLPIYFYDYSAPFKLDNPNDANILKTLVTEKNIRLVVVDTFNRVHRAKDLSSPSDVGSVFEPLKAILEQTAVILIHHSNKSGFARDVPTPEEILGSVDFIAETDLLFTLRKKDKNTVEVHNLKSRDSELIKPFQLTFTAYPDGTADFTFEADIEVAETPVEAREQAILNFLDRGKASKENLISHMESIGEKEGTVNNTLTTLKRKGKISSELVENKAWYFLVDSQYGAVPNSGRIGSEKSGNHQKNIVTTIQNVSQLSSETILEKEKELRDKLNTIFDKKSLEYSNSYHEWFALRERGVEQGLFKSFIPIEKDAVIGEERNI